MAISGVTTLLDTCRRFLTIAWLMVIVCLGSSPAHAALTADFNDDGVLDAIVLPQPPDTNVVVRISGAAPQILKLTGRLISIVIADLDHDGHVDLGALSEQRGIHLWMNNRGDGRFTHVQRRTPRGEDTLARPGPRASPSSTTDQQPAAPENQDDL